GIYVTSGSPILQNVWISDTMASRGGGLYNEAGVVAADGLIIHGARAESSYGGGLYNGSEIALYNSVFFSNTAALGGGGIYNAGIMDLTNNTLYANQAGTFGGGLYDHDSGSLILRNTIVVSNVAQTGGGVYRDSAGLLDADYNNVWGNVATTLPQGNLPVAPHDISVDPLFVDGARGDFHLTIDSLCVDAADPDTTLDHDFEGDTRPSQQGYDIGADELGGCFARVVVPSSGEVLGPIYTSVQDAVDAAPPNHIVQISGICLGVRPRLVGAQVISQTAFISKSLTLEGGYPSDFEFEEGEEPVETILNARGMGRVLAVVGSMTETVHVSRLTLWNGYAGDYGGVVYNDGAQLELDDVIVAKGDALYGGGVANYAGSLTLGAVRVMTSTAVHGGGLFNLASTTTISPTHFVANVATGQGGAVHNTGGGTLILDAGTLVSNAAAVGGGLYNAASGVLYLTNTIVASNTAVMDGGGLYNLASTLVVRHDTFYANHAGDEGGGIYHDAGSTVPIINSTLVVSNTAGAAVDAGGGVYVADAAPAFDYNDLYGNQPTNYGGSLVPGTGTGNISADPDFLTIRPDSSKFLRIPSGSPVEDVADPNSPILTDIDGAPRPANRGFDIGADEVGDCYVRINGLPPTYGSVQRAIDDANAGDVLYIAGTCLGVNERDVGGELLLQTAFVDKSLGFQGGYTRTNWTDPDPLVYTTTLDALGEGRVVYVDASPVITMSGLHLRGGSAPEGGGLFVEGGVFTMTQSHVYSNTASEGGGFYNSGAHVVLDGNFFHGNEATADGGAFYQSGGTALLQNTFLYHNTAQRGGGIYNAAGAASLTVLHDTLYANTANEGGGLYTENHVPMIRNTIFATNTATTGHAIYSQMTGYIGLYYNDVFPETGAYRGAVGSTDLHENPRFVRAENNNLRLADDSPLFDAGDPTTTLYHDFEGDLRPADQGFDIGADERRGCWARIVRGSDENEEIFGPFANPQLAINSSQPGDVIQVTAGDCRGVHPYGSTPLYQTVHITSDLNLKGGYSRDFAERYETDIAYPDPDGRLTIFDAQHGGRALLITNTTVVTVERVVLLHGQASG
ncbi:MAG: choice-of-anchor Q domain-containing protein, partial [Anaerolineae bacterium]